MSWEKNRNMNQPIVQMICFKILLKYSGDFGLGPKDRFVITEAKPDMSQQMRVSAVPEQDSVQPFMLPFNRVYSKMA